MSLETKNHEPRCTLCNDTGYIHKKVRLGGARRDTGITSSLCTNPECLREGKARKTVEAAAPAVSVSELLRRENARQWGAS